MVEDSVLDSELDEESEFEYVVEVADNEDTSWANFLEYLSM